MEARTQAKTEHAPKQCVAEADDILENGWKDANYGTISIHCDMPWALPDQQSRSWNYRLHCWHMMRPFLNAYQETQDRRYFDPILRIALDWVEQNGDSAREGISPFAWYDMAVGVRAGHLSRLIVLAGKNNSVDEGTRQILWSALELHQAYLADDANIVFHNNHGFYQVAGQLAMGRRFADRSPLMAQALEQGKQRLRDMIDRHFAHDGIHKEHSPYYFQMVCKTFGNLIGFGLVDDEEAVVFALTIEAALSWFVLPSRHLANFGDSNYEVLSFSPQEAEERWQTPAMRYAASGGQTGALPEGHVAAFLEGGYFVARKPDPAAPDDFSRCSYLAQTAAFHSRIHRHADDLSFIWSDRGSYLLVDAGRYGYIGKTVPGSALWLDGHWYSDENRVYCESTRAHNCLEFDGRNYPRKGVKPYGSALGRWLEDPSGVIAVETLCQHFGTVRHSRVLLFMPGQWLLVLDCFRDSRRQAHTVRQWFHFAPALAVSAEGDGYGTPVPTSPQPLRLLPLLEGMEPSRIYCGERGDRMQGWFSPGEREIVPNPACCFEQDGVAPGALAALFSFSETLAADREWSSVNASGRNGRFRWRDERGRHTLTLGRPDDGPLALAYVCE